MSEVALTRASGPRAVPELISSLEPTLAPLRSHLSDLAALIPPQQFYRYSDSFSRSIQQASFIIVFRVFLEREDVPSKEEVAQQLGSTLLSRSGHAPPYRLILALPLQSRRNGRITSSSRPRNISTASSLS